MRAIILALLLAGCATQSVRDSSALISPGDGKDRVLSILGAPGDRSFRDNSEAWQYCSTGVMADEFITIWFVSDEVRGLTNYTSSGSNYIGSCTQGFRPVDWGQVPAAVEVDVNLGQQ